MEETDGFEKDISQALEENRSYRKGLTWRHIPMHRPGQGFFTALALGMNVMV